MIALVSRSQTAFSSLVFEQEDIKEEKAVWLRETMIAFRPLLVYCLFPVPMLSKN